MSELGTLQSYIKTVVAQNDDDLEQAKEVVLDEADDDPALRTRLVEYAVETLVEYEWRAGRAAVLRGASQGPTAPSCTLMTGLRAQVVATHMKYMDYQMPGGKRLGDCTKEEIERVVTQQKKQAATSMKRACWLGAVAGLLKPKQVVRKVLKEADLDRLYRQQTAGKAV